MRASSSRPAPCASCSTTRSTPTPRRCSARCRSSAARNRCSPSRVSRPTSRRCRRAARFIRAAPKPCRAAPARRPMTCGSPTAGPRAAGAPRHASRKPTGRCMPPRLEAEGLTNPSPSVSGVFPRRVAWVKAVDGIDFAVEPGETLGVIGESGCGKTTTAKMILLQESPSGGTIRFDGKDVAALAGAELMRYRREVQVVFQDPYSSLSPRMRVGEIIPEPLQIHSDLPRQQQRERVAEVLELVGLRPEVARLFPHEFSGGQRQRIAIARALVTETRLIVLDEPVSALDVSIRAQIMNQLEELQAKLGVSYLFIGHDLATVAHISRRIVV